MIPHVIDGSNYFLICLFYYLFNTIFVPINKLAKRSGSNRRPFLFVPRETLHLNIFCLLHLKRCILSFAAGVLGHSNSVCLNTLPDENQWKNSSQYLPADAYNQEQFLKVLVSEELFRKE